MSRRRHAMDFEPRPDGRPLVQVTLRLAAKGVAWKWKLTDFVVDTGAHRTILNTDVAAFVRAARTAGGLAPPTRVRPIETLNGAVNCRRAGPVDLVFSEGSNEEFTVRIKEVLLHPTLTGQSVLGMDVLTQAQLTMAGIFDVGCPSYNHSSTGWLERTVPD